MQDELLAVSTYNPKLNNTWKEEEKFIKQLTVTNIST